jgi:hypothetical protein
VGQIPYVVDSIEGGVQARVLHWDNLKAGDEGVSFAQGFLASHLTVQVIGQFGDMGVVAIEGSIVPCPSHSSDWSPLTDSDGADLMITRSGNLFNVKERLVSIRPRVLFGKEDTDVTVYLLFRT